MPRPAEVLAPMQLREVGPPRHTSQRAAAAVIVDGLDEADDVQDRAQSCGMHPDGAHDREPGQRRPPWRRYAVEGTGKVHLGTGASVVEPGVPQQPAHVRPGLGHPVRRPGREVTVGVLAAYPQACSRCTHVAVSAAPASTSSGRHTSQAISPTPR